MGTRASRIQEESVSSTLGKDGTKRDSYRRPRCARPTSLMVDFSGSFEDNEVNRSRSEEGSDSDLGQHGASADDSPADQHNIPSAVNQASPADDSNSEGKPEEDGNVSPDPPVVADHQPEEETGRTPQRTFSERLPGNRHSSSRSVGARSARVRGTHPRPVSEAWIGLYRFNNRHGSKFTYLCNVAMFSIQYRLIACGVKNKHTWVLLHNSIKILNLHFMTVYLQEYVFSNLGVLLSGNNGKIKCLNRNKR